MDSGTRRRLIWGFLANWISRLAATIIQLVQLPVFLHYWSVPLYGDWLIVNSVPTYLSFSSVGFGSVAGNEMTMMVAREDRETALRVFQSCWWLIVGICCGVIFLLSCGLYLLPAARLLKIDNISQADTKWIVFYLGVSVMLGQLEHLLQSAYRCIGRYPYGSFVKSMMSLIAFACTLVPVARGHGPRATALVFALVNVAGTAFLSLLVKRDIPWIEFGWKHASVAEIRALVRPAIAFMGFPIGNSLNFAGTQLAVNYALGPVSVVIFSATRTVSRGALQMVQMVGGTFEPELGISYGAGKFELTRALHRRACQLTLITAVLVVGALMSVGPWIIEHWGRGHIPPSRGLLGVLLVVVIFFSLWSTSATLMTATNQHQKMAVVFLLGTTLTCVCCYFFARWQGLWGAAASLLISELAMNAYVLPASLRIAHDTFPAFMASMVHYPPSLKPAAVLGRLRRVKG